MVFRVRDRARRRLSSFFLIVWLVVAIGTINALATSSPLSWLQAIGLVLLNFVLLLQGLVTSFDAAGDVIVTDGEIIRTGPRGWRLPRNQVSFAGWNGPAESTLVLHVDSADATPKVKNAITMSRVLSLGRSGPQTILVPIDPRDAPSMQQVIASSPGSPQLNET